MYHSSMGRIDVFDREYFESVLPARKSNGAPLWTCVGSESGELVYTVEMDDRDGVAILIRSSIDPDTFYSKGTGKDSIRLYLITADGLTLSMKTHRWITRKAGWESRMLAAMSKLREMRQAAGNCPKCGNPKSIFKTKKVGENQGRFFTKCPKDGGFEWL